jgi:hypothetical protein
MMEGARGGSTIRAELRVRQGTNFGAGRPVPERERFFLMATAAFDPGPKAAGFFQSGARSCPYAMWDKS